MTDFTALFESIQERPFNGASWTETRWLIAGIRERDAEIVALRQRLRVTAQTIIAEIGAAGPQDAEEAATRAVEEIKRLNRIIDDPKYKVNS